MTSVRNVSTNLVSMWFRCTVFEMEMAAAAAVCKCIAVGNSPTLECISVQILSGMCESFATGRIRHRTWGGAPIFVCKARRNLQQLYSRSPTRSKSAPTIDGVAAFSIRFLTSPDRDDGVGGSGAGLSGMDFRQYREQ